MLLASPTLILSYFSKYLYKPYNKINWDTDLETEEDRYNRILEKLNSENVKSRGKIPGSFSFMAEAVLKIWTTGPY